MSSDVLVSIVVPSYNGAAHIAQTLAAVQRQSYRHWELLLVDDGSTDDTVRIALQALPQARPLHTERRGVSVARNTGLAAASGQLICFLDQDDVWFPQHLQCHVDCLSIHPEWGAVFGPYKFWHADREDEANADTLLPPRPLTAVDASMNGWIYHQLLADCWALTSATTLRRSLLVQHGGFNAQQEFGEEWELWLRLAQHTQFARLTWPPVLYRQHLVQGSRVARPVDYRTRLLEDAARRYGLRSRDGRSMDCRAFQSQLGRYQMAFGRQHLQAGNRLLGVRALVRAWRRDPARLRYLALAAAGACGYRPRADWSDALPDRLLDAVQR